MLNSTKIAKAIVRAGAAALILTAFAHLYLGFPFVERAILNSTLNAEFSGAFKAIWVAFSSHLFIVSSLLLIYAFKRGVSQKPFIILCGIVPVIDALLLTVWVSAAHIGVMMLSVSGALILIGGGLARSSSDR